MKRVDRIYDYLIEHGQLGLTTKEIADELMLRRNNVSTELNRLVTSGKVTKEYGKPVLYFPCENQEMLSQDVLTRFSEENPSLGKAIEQGRAAVLYPPNGMNTLILGQTGTGKTMFAELLFTFGKEVGKFNDCHQLTIFNCADYANNIQLLLSQLFGVKKGAYTGAVEDQKGLVEMADGGILFLDEIHRLPPEGQEMLFSFIDRGTYKKMGETEVVHYANVMIVAATTEDPSSALLDTFSRRIPMVIEMPALKDRSIEERFHLIRYFLQEEAARLDETITISANAIRALLNYPCERNIGELQADIQLSCAKIYADYLMNKIDKIRISELDIPEKVQSSMLSGTNHRKLWNNILNSSQKDITFTGASTSYIKNSSYPNQDIYEIISAKKNQLTNQGVTGKELETSLNREVKKYFNEYFSQVAWSSTKSSIGNFVTPSIIKVSEKAILYAEEKLDLHFGKSVFYGLTFHLDNVIKRLKNHRYEESAHFRNIENEFPKAYQVAVDCIEMMNTKLDIHVPLSEARYLTMFFVYGNGLTYRNDVQVFVLCHGESTATSMVNFVKELLEIECITAFDVPVTEKPKKTLERVKEFIITKKIKNPILLMVDMGSLGTFEQNIMEELDIAIKTIQLTSTLHVLEASRKAMMHYSLEDVYSETLAVNFLLEDELRLIKNEEKSTATKFAIVSICTTGKGAAQVIKNMLKRDLDFDGKLFEIFNLYMASPNELEGYLRKLSKKYNILCIISPFHLDFGYPHFDLEDIIAKGKVEEIQYLIDLEQTYEKLGNTLANQLKYINAKEAVTDVKKIIQNLGEKLNIFLSINIRIGILVHMVCMIDRTVLGADTTIFSDKKTFIYHHANEIEIIQRVCEVLEEKYKIIISDDEYCYILSFFMNTH